MGNIFNTILVYPLLNLLVFFYNFIPDLGVVIILVTVLVRLALLPSFHKSLKHQKAMQELQPKMNELKEKYKDDKEQQAKALMELYKVHKVNPLSSCLPMLIQFPILIALYFVFIQSLNGETLQGIYGFIQAPESLNPLFLGFLDLSKRNIILAVLAGGLQYWQGRMMAPRNQGGDQMSKIFSYQTLYFFPFLTFIIGLQFPAGLPLYWVVTTLFGVGQQYFIIHREAKEVLKNASS
ncbi:MAG: membrane protein insertase YidC [Candidatus Doudnabacteria bacterium]|nr:membrane protein insertase YidC [Candidatus Doudnabacteria bacterium]